MSKSNKEQKEANRQLILDQINEYRSAQDESKRQIAQAEAESKKLAEAEKARQKEEEERKAKAQQQEVEQREAQQKYESVLAKQTGESGYGKALDLATKGAALTSAQAGQAAQQAARQSGMSKAQAAQLGAQNAANTYAQNIANQQNVANQQLQANVAGNLSGAGLTGQFSSANTQNAQQGVSNAQMGVGNTQQGIANQMQLAGLAQGQQGLAQSGMEQANAQETERQNRAWTGVNNTINAIGTLGQAAGSIISAVKSDKRAKESEKVELPDARKAIDDIGTRLLAHNLKGKKLPKIEPTMYAKKTIIEVGK